MPILADEDEIRDLLKKTTRIDRGSYQYYREHLEQIQESHGGNIVAIVDKGVVKSIDSEASTEELMEFVKDVREEYGDEVYLTHVAEPDQTLLL